MAVIKYDELFDFLGYKQAIKDLEAANKEFGKTVNSINDRIAAQYREIKIELDQYTGILKSFNVNQKSAGDAIIATGEAAIAAGKKMADQKRIMQELQGVVDLSTRSVNDLKTGYKALETEYNAIEGKEEKDIVRKKQLSQEAQRLKGAINEQTASLKITKQALDSAEGSYNKMQAELKSIGIQLKALPGAFDAATGKINKHNKEAVILSQRYLEINNSLKVADAQMGNFTRNVGNYSSAFHGFADGIKHAGLEILSMIGLVSVASFFKDSVEDAIEADKAFRLLQNTLRTIGMPELFGEIEESAKKLQGQFKFLHEPDIIGVFNKLIVYGKLTKGQINELIPVIINFSSAYGTNLADSTSTILKALEGNGKALKEFGINMKDAKSVTEGFDLVMKQLKPSIDGVASAFGESAAGKIAATKEEFRKLKEEVGNGLLPLLVKLLSFVDEGVKGLDALANAVSAELSGSVSGISSFLLSTFKDNKDVQYEIESSRKLYMSGFENDLKSLKALQAEGKKIGVTEDDLIKERIKNLQVVKKQYDALVNESAKKGNPGFNELASRFATQQALGKSISELQEKLGANVKLGAPGKDDADKQRGGGKSATELENERIKKSQEALEAFSQKRIALFELAKEYGIVSEQELADQRLAIIQKYTKAAIELENSKTKSKPDTKVIDDLKKKEIDAEKENKKFHDKATEDSIKSSYALQSEGLKNEQEAILASKVLTNKQREALEVDYLNRIDALHIEENNKLIAIENDLEKRKALLLANEELQRGINSRNRQLDEKTAKKDIDDRIEAQKKGFEIIRAMRNTSFIDEVNNIRKLQKIYEDAQKAGVDTTKEANEAKYALDILYADKKKKLNEQVEATVIQGVQAGLEIAQNLTDARYENAIANLEANRKKELALAGTNAVAQQAINDKYDKKVAEQKNKQARADRNFALFQVAINTAQAVTKSIAEWGMPFALPFIALSVVAGALQAAVILSKPLPKYKTGRKDGPAEYAIVDEAGPELIVDKHGRLQEVGGNKPRVTHLDDGSQVITASETKKIFNDTRTNNIFHQSESERLIKQKLIIDRLKEVATTNFSKEVQKKELFKNIDTEINRKNTEVELSGRLIKNDRTSIVKNFTTEIFKQINSQANSSDVKTNQIVREIKTDQLLKNINTSKILREIEMTAQLSSVIREGKENETIYIMSKAMQNGGIDQRALEQSFLKAVSQIPIQQWISDERGQRKREKKVNSTVTYLNNLSKL